MGFYLFHESMLQSVLHARDKWLKPDGTMRKPDKIGLMFPCWTKLYVAPVSMEKFFTKKFDFWKDVYGFNFSSVIPFVQQSELGVPKVATNYFNSLDQNTLKQAS
jgi:hypothetical protein